MYLWNDFAAMLFYRRQVDWTVITRMIPLLIVGMLLGTWVLDGIDAERFRILTGVVILTMLALSLWLDRSKATFMRHPLAAWGAGVLSGIISMTSNSAGPVISLYLMEQRVSKATYLSTRTWLFVFVNLAKIPLAISLGLLTVESTKASLWTLPGLACGALLGIWLVGKLKLEQFKWGIRAIAAIAAIKIFIYS